MLIPRRVAPAALWGPMIPSPASRERAADVLRRASILPE
jgi:hypothetical protein